MKFISLLCAPSTNLSPPQVNSKLWHFAELSWKASFSI